MTRYFAMWSDPPFAEADKQWREGLIESGCMCARCGRLRPGRSIGTTILRRRLGDYPLSSTAIALEIKIIRNDLMVALGSPVPCEIGPIFLASGDKLGGFQFLLAERMQVRGGMQSDLMGVCHDCGSVNYYPLPQPHKGGVRYLLKSSVEKTLPIYKLAVGGLALREDVYNRVAAQNFPGLNFYELPIRDEPEDGLPANLKPYLTPEEQVAMGDILWRDYAKSQRRAAEARKKLSEHFDRWEKAQNATNEEEYYRVIYGDLFEQWREGRRRREERGELPPLREQWLEAKRRNEQSRKSRLEGAPRPPSTGGHQ